jgi:tellurite resistance protein
VASLVAVTVADGIIPPEESETVPEIADVLVCAKTPETRRTLSANTEKTFR